MDAPDGDGGAQRGSNPPPPEAGPPPRITQAMEDYLKAAYRVGEEGGPVTTQRLADALGVSGPSVTNMVKRLHDLRLLRHTRYHGVELTQAGERVAVEVIRHHRLLELYLAASLGYPWDEVHAEAERLEHHLSEELESRLDSALGHPTRDPHGDPIPTPDGFIPPVSEIRLLDLPAGASATVCRVSDRDPDQLRVLGDLRLYPGTAVTIVDDGAPNGPLRVRVDGRDQVLPRPVAAAVHVEAPAS